jgi:hypothetical protein
MRDKYVSRRGALTGFGIATLGTAHSPQEAREQGSSVRFSPDADLFDARRSGEGTLHRTQRDRNERDFVSLLDFCSGSESEDASPGLARAISKVLELGAELHVPRGTYRLTETIKVNLTDAEFRGFAMRGIGLGSRFTWDGGNNEPILHITGRSGVGWYSKIVIGRLHLIGNSFEGDKHRGVDGIVVGDAGNAMRGICNLTLEGMTIRRVANGIRAYYESDEVTVFDCYIERFTNYGIFNDAGGSNWTILSNHISDGGARSTGIRTALSSSRIIANTLQGKQYRTAIQIDGGADRRGQSPYVEGNYIECQLDMVNGIMLRGVQGGSVSTNVFKGCRGANLIRLEPAPDGMACRNIRVGGHTHHVSGGYPNAFVSATADTVNCAVSDHLESIEGDTKPGRFLTGTIVGMFSETFQDGIRSPRGLDVGNGALRIGVVPNKADFGVSPQPATDLEQDLGSPNRRWDTVMARTLGLATGNKAPKPLAANAQLYFDSDSNSLKVVLPDGTVCTIQTTA